MLFSNIGFSGQIGYYLHYPYLKPAPIYTRLGLQYYFAKHLAYIGVNLKAHNARADYIEWCIGFQLHKKAKIWKELFNQEAISVRVVPPLNHGSMLDPRTIWVPDGKTHLIKEIKNKI